MEIKIFEGTEESVYRDCVNEGYVPATIKQTHDLMEEGKIPKQWYNVSEILSPNFKIRKIKKSECLNLKKFAQKGGRVSCLYDLYSDGNFSASNRRVLKNAGRLVGVKR
jgi:hypothetical protein